MKAKHLLAIGLMMTLATAQAQMKFIIHYEQVITERGELADYALECIGQDNAILQSDTVYTLLSIKRAIKPAPATKQTIQQRKDAKPEPTKHDDHFFSRVPKYAPLSEEAVKAVSPAKRAAAVAKQIFRIRETRNYILSGEVEHMPADGRSMKLVLDELKRQEKALMELFLGRKTVRKEVKVVTANVDESALKADIILARYSDDKGFVPEKDTTVAPIMLHVQRYTQRVLADEQPKKKKAEPIYETRITRSDIRVVYDDETMLFYTVKE